MKKMILMMLILATGCGKDSNSSSSASNLTPITIQEMSEKVEGNYRVVLRPLNSQIHGFIATGSGKIHSRNNVLEINIVMDDITNAPHYQNLYSGSACPKTNADTNGDGFIDVKEAEASIGKVLIPLDADLSGQLKGYGTNPSGSAYEYSKKAYLDILLTDLKDTDEATIEPIVKLPDHVGLELEGRVIMVHGARDSVKLPDSIRSWPNHTKHQSLPIACGVIQKVE